MCREIEKKEAKNKKKKKKRIILMIWINISITRVTMSYFIVRYFFNQRRLQTMLSTLNSGGKVSYRLFNFFFPHSFQMILSYQSVILTSCSD